MTTSNTNNPHIFMDIKFGKAKAGRIVIELFANLVPKSAENFRQLCTGEKGIGKSGKPLHYKGSKFHRVVPQCMVQGGDITNGNGAGGESIYGESFEDENFLVSHEEIGIVGMSNKGPNTSQSQFYITTVPCFHLDEKNVGIGKVVKGLNIVIEMSDLPRDEHMEPLQDIVIYDCGELKPGEPWNIEENDGTEDVYPPWPNDWDIKVHSDEIIKNAIKKIKESGNIYFKRKNYVDSERKYVKTLRYIDWYIYNNKQTHKIVELKNVALLNLAAVKIQLEKNKDAVELLTQVITNDPENSKAYYRRARARLYLKDYDKALDDLNTAISLNPNNKDVTQLLNETKRKKLDYLKIEKRAFSKLFTQNE